MLELSDLAPDQVVSVVSNAIGWSMFSEDGRAVSNADDGTPMIEVTQDECDRCTAAAKRALQHLDVLRHPFDDLRRFQAEQGAWSEANFDPIDPPGHIAAMGVAEETGELADALAEALSLLRVVSAMGKINHGQIKGEQSIRYTPEQIQERKRGAVGDILVYLSDYCTRSGIDMADALADTWAEVCQRDWREDPINAARKVQEAMQKIPADGIYAGAKVVAIHSCAYKGEEPYEAQEGEIGTITGTPAVVPPESGGIFIVWDGDPEAMVRPVLYGDIKPLTGVTHYTGAGRMVVAAPMPDFTPDDPEIAAEG